MDNFFRECPPLMSDGRLFTDYRTPTRRNEYYKYINGIARDDDYRMFLQNNTNVILDKEWEFNKKKTGCWVNGCIHTYPTRTIPDYFADERRKFDAFFNPTKPRDRMKCQVHGDYRLTETPNSNNQYQKFNEPTCDYKTQSVN